MGTRMALKTGREWLVLLGAAKVDVDHRGISWSLNSVDHFWHLTLKIKQTVKGIPFSVSERA